MSFLGLGLGLNTARHSGLFLLPYDALNNININTNAGVLERLFQENAVDISGCGL